jgi:Asp-tRNA(Asn)/Glu-tRNA(Gln) amidotransferase A subunit family amidase
MGIEKSRSSRRGFLRTLAGAGAAAALAASDARASPPPAASSTAPSTGQTIADSDIATMASLTGHNFSPDEIEMMRGAVASNRRKLIRLHTDRIDPSTGPAVNFDPRLPELAYPSGGESFFRLSDRPLPKYNGNIHSLAFASAADLSRLIHARKITSVELTKMYLDRLDNVGRKLNAVITLTSDLALKQAKRADAELHAGQSRGPLHGLPWGAKDLLATRGIPTTWGVGPFRNRIFDYDATVVKRLEAAGAVLCAKLSMGELAMGDIWFGGQTKCPWDPSLKEGSGGSSAGPAATVAAGCVAFAIGSETMGSIVSPCMINGVTGLRPTYGRVSRYGAMALAPTLDKLGPITRSVEDGAMVLSAICGFDNLDASAARDVAFRWDGEDRDLSSLHIGYDAAAFEEISKSDDKQKRQTYALALNALHMLAGDLVPVQLPRPDPYVGIAGLIIACESACSFTELIDSGDVRKLVQQGSDDWPNVFRSGSLIPASDYLRAMKIRTQLMRAFHEATRQVDLYVTIPCVGPTISMSNLTGHPTLIARCGISQHRRPFMIEFLAQPYREAAALKFALAYERSTNWNNTWPEI